MRLIGASLTVAFLFLGITAGLFSCPVSALGATVPFVQTLADAKNDVCTGINLTSTGSTGSSCGDNGAQVNSVIANIVNLLSAVVGVIAVIVIIVAGLRFITSGGDTQGVAKARNALIYALVGLVIVALAQLMVHFVLGQTSVAGG